jgi:hypothetical protein
MAVSRIHKRSKPGTADFSFAFQSLDVESLPTEYGPTSSEIPDKLCDYCTTAVFTPSFFSKIARLWARDQDPDVKCHEYETPARGIFNSYQQQCPWCRRLVIAMYTALPNENDDTDEFKWGGSDGGLLDLLQSSTMIQVKLSLDFLHSSQTGTFTAIVSCEGEETGKLQLSFEFHTSAMGMFKFGVPN